MYKLLRFELPVAAGVCVIMGQLLAAGKFAPIDVTILGFMSVFLISASILVLNDYFDVETDKVNAPHRPIPSNLVSPSEALIFAISLLAIGLSLSYSITRVTFFISISLAIVGFLYNRYFKKTGLPGNFMVSFSVGMTFIYGGASVGLPFNKIVLLFGFIAALIDLAEEIAADAMDVKGDAIINSNSIAIKHGKRKAITVSFYIFMTVILLSVIPFLFKWFSPVYLIPILIMDLSIAYPAIKFLKSKGEEGRKYIRYIYLGATSGLVVFIMMRLLEA